MAAGAQQNGAQVNAQAEYLTKQLNVLMTQIGSFHDWLAAHPSQVLQAAPYSLSSDDVADLGSAFNDLEQLRTIYLGEANLTNAKDFTVFTSRLWGFGY